MRDRVSGLLIALITAGAVTEAIAEPMPSLPSASRSSVYMQIYGQVPAPYGFVRYCESRADGCIANGFHETRFQPSAVELSELDEINRSVNSAIKPVTDLEAYGVSEYWTIPTDKGDCEDYALLKQQILISRGWPTSALLMTVVRDERGEGHAVLTVRTSQGDYILDNKIDELRLWNHTDYEFVMRQSYVDPRVWVSLSDDREKPPQSLAGVSAP
jgi:predicted transglutaminase-like cysteine proteinase